jgi:hypothetical protein
MKKTSAKFRFASGLLVLIIAVCVIGLINYAIAQPSFTQTNTTNLTFRSEVIDETAKIAANTLLGESSDITLGSSVIDTATDDGQYSRTNNFAASGCIRQDSGSDTDDGIDLCMVSGPCADATSTLWAIPNDTGEDIIVKDFIFSMTSGASTTISVIVGTSSVPYTTWNIGGAPDVLEGTGLASIYLTGEIATSSDTTVTTTHYFRDESSTSLPLDTRDLSGTWNRVIIGSGEYFFGSVTTSPGYTDDSYGSLVTSTSNTLDCEYKLWYYTID